ncbi:MAG: PhoH family protein [Candidatus Aenigmarchaeota archaeon]|nr:PhoH family protein [Candidatus Aenigmarchaeota archaeon]
MAKKDRKIYVIDTSVLIYSPLAINEFLKKDHPNSVYISPSVLFEIDKLKKEKGYTGDAAMEFSKWLEESIRKSRGKFSEGTIHPYDGGSINIRPQSEYEMPKELSREESFLDSNVDKDIIALAKSLKDKRNTPVILVSRDINMRIVAQRLGITAEDYRAERIKKEDIYSGLRLIEKGVIKDGDSIDKLHSAESVYRNQYFYTMDGDVIEVFREKNGKIVKIPVPKGYKITPKNIEQKCAMDALLDPNIQLVTLFGEAGTGKTLLALDAGIKQVLEKDGKYGSYKKLYVARPIVPMGRDIGYLPGSEEMKLGPWMDPIFDNLAFLSEGTQKTKFDEQAEETECRKKHRGRGQKQKNRETEPEESYEESNKENAILEYMKAKRLIDIKALTYIRGRSIPGQYIIIDESQNLTPHEIKTIISRAGNGTKIVLTGDIMQIDRYNLDMQTNGLSHVIGKMKGEPNSAHDNSLYANIGFIDVVRSPLAELATLLL